LLEASFSCPVCLCIDTLTNDIICTDFNNCKVRRISLSNGFVSTIIGQAGRGYSDGELSQAKFDNPVGVCAVGSDLIIADYRNQKIRKISGNLVTTVAGSEKGFRDGENPQFESPIGICYYLPRIVLVTDAEGHKIRQVFV